MQNNVPAIVSMYEHSMYNQWTSQRATLWEHENKLVSAFCPDADARFLIIGCGSGRETLAIYEKGYRNISAIDPTPALLDVARERAAAKQYAVNFHLADTSSIPYPDAVFDTITMFENIYGHITPKTARLQALRELNRVLKPGGLILMEATSLLSEWRHYVVIRLMEIGRSIRNPHRLEPGDKLMRGAKEDPLGAVFSYARSHWFRPSEIDDEAMHAGFRVLLQSTVAGVRENPKVNSWRLHCCGRFIYVLQKTSSPVSET